MGKSVEVDVHTIICEKATFTEDRLDIYGVFNSTQANNSSIPFSVVTTTVINNSEVEVGKELYIYIVLEANINDETRYKLIKELDFEIKDQGIEQSLNIFNFKTRKLISSPGIYYFRAYMLEEEADLRTVLQSGEKISSAVLEVK